MLCALSAHAGPGLFQGKVRHKRDVRAEVEAVDRRWVVAESTNDADAMEKLLSEDYLGISGNGQVLTRTQLLDRMRARTTTVKITDMQDTKVKLLGTTAIVTSQATLDGNFEGHPAHGRFRSTRVYKRVAGTWQLTSFEATPERERPQ